MAFFVELRGLWKTLWESGELRWANPRAPRRCREIRSRHPGTALTVPAALLSFAEPGACGPRLTRRNGTTCMQIERRYTMPEQAPLAGRPTRRIRLEDGTAMQVPAGWTLRAAHAFAAQVPGARGETGLADAVDALTARLSSGAKVSGFLTDPACLDIWAHEMRQMVMHRIAVIDPALWSGRIRGSEPAVWPLQVRMAQADGPQMTCLAEAVRDGAPLAFDFETDPRAAAPRVVLDLRCFVEDGQVAVAALVHAVRLWTLALAVAAGRKAVPGDLGLAGLGGALMRLGLGHATREGRIAAAAMGALAEAARAAVAAELGLAPGAGDAHARAGLARLEAKSVPHAAREALTYARALWAGIDEQAAPDAPAAPRIAIAPLGPQAAIFGLGDDPLAPLAELRMEMATERGHRRGAAPELRAGLAAQGYGADRIEALIRHVAGHGSLAAAPGIDHAALRARGLDAQQIARIEAALPEARDLRTAVTPWRLGTAFCASRLGLDAAAMPGQGMGLLEQLGFIEAQIETANRHVFGTGFLRGAPGIAPRDAAAFDCAPEGAGGPQYVGPRARLAMATALARVIGGPVVARLPLPDAADAGTARAAIRAARRAGLAGLVLSRDAEAAQRMSGATEASADALSLAPRLREILAMLPPGIRPGSAPSEMIELLEAARRSRPEARRHARALRERLLADPLPQDRGTPRVATPPAGHDRAQTRRG